MSDRRGSVLRALEAIGQSHDDRIDVAEGALMLADYDRPATDLGPYRRHLDALAGARLGGDSVEDKASALRHLLAGQYGYAGDLETYDDLDNANLMRVIDRRCGLPVALSILYIHAARAQGWDAAGLNFPAHFLIRLEADGARAVIDPFNGGTCLGPAALRGLIKSVGGNDAELHPDYYSAVSDRDILFRLHNNIRMRRLQTGDLPGATHATIALQALRPEEPRLTLEAGLMRARLGDKNAAIDDLERYMTMGGQEADRMEAARVLATLKESPA